MSLSDFLDDLQPGEMDQWWRIPAIRDAYLKKQEEYLASGETLQDLVWKEGSKGIVICGGGVSYYPSLWVNVHQIRRTGCVLPIQIWHMGDREMDPWMKKNFSHLGVEFVDAFKKDFTPVGKDGYPCRWGWQLKTHAILHSPFQHVLFLDADCWPLRDPTPLFASQEYGDSGAIFFLDDAPHQLDKWQFDAFGVKAKLFKEGDGEQYRKHGPTVLAIDGMELAWETGQFLVNKRSSLNALLLADWYAQHSDYYWRIVHGDKETLHMAFLLMGQMRGGMRFEHPFYWPILDGNSFIHRWFDGTQVFQHRTRDKWSLAKRGDPDNGLSPIDKWAEGMMDDLRRVWGGRRMWQNTHPNDVERVGMKEAAGYYTLSGGGGWHLRDDGFVGASGIPEERIWSIWDDKTRLLLSVSGGTEENGFNELLHLYWYNQSYCRWEAITKGSPLIQKATERQREALKEEKDATRKCVILLMRREEVNWGKYAVMNWTYWCILHGYQFFLQWEEEDNHKWLMRARSWVEVSSDMMIADHNKTWEDVENLSSHLAPCASWNASFVGVHFQNVPEKERPAKMAEWYAAINAKTFPRDHAPTSDQSKRGGGGSVSSRTRLLSLGEQNQM